jgi:serine protease Do
VLALPAWAQQRSLAGFQYIHVVPPTYQGNRTDIYGYGAFLTEELQKDRSWILLPSLKAVDADRQKLSQTLICTIGHQDETVTLSFFDVLGNPLASFASSGFGFGSAYARGLVIQQGGNPGITPGDVQRNIKGALKKLRSARPRFDPKQVVDLATLFKNVERVDMSEQQLDKYLSENHSTLAPIEGIWAEQEGQYRIGIIAKQHGSPGGQFVAFIIESANALWDPGMVKAKLTPTAYDTAFVARFFMGDHTEVGSTAKLDGGVLSFPVRYREKDDIVNFIRVSPAGSPTVARDRTPTMGGEAVSTGTGFLCRNDLIATNYHVIRDGSRWDVTFPSTHQSFGLELVLSDKANDLAVLKLVRKEGEKASAKPLKIVDSTTARVGEELYTIGFPLGDLLGSGHKVATGVLSAAAGLEDDPRMFQLTVPTQPGNSGGPVLNQKGEVVGILASTLSVEYLYKNQGHIPQNVNFAIKSDYLSMLLRQAPGAGLAQPPLEISTLPRADQVARVMDSVGQIKAYK